MKRFVSSGGCCLFACLALAVTGTGDQLTTLQYHIIGTQLQVSPAVLSVPKGVAGSVRVELRTGEAASTNATSMTEGAYVEATLRGPAFEARRLLGQPNAALMLPPLNLVGDYQLDNIRLIDANTGAVRMEGSPNSVPVRVFDEVLISRVTSRPLTYSEIQEKGIVIDQNNFRAVEFEVGFVLNGKTIPVKFPVVAPSFKESTEIIPKAELEARLAKAQEINRNIAATAELPPELQTANLNFEIEGINFQRVEAPEVDLNLHIPPIPALMVIPGNIGFLHQFFSVQIFTENGAPADSGLSVLNIKAELVLPPGPDLILSTNYSQSGDDPLRFARIGAGQAIQNIQSVVRPGADGKTGTADDIGRLYPGESGQGEFLVEGLQEGLHVMDLKLTADLDGLAAGTVKIQGKAAGSVLVRNPTFSMAFAHPRTVRAGEPYDAYVTILNTSYSPANLVSVTLSASSLSGGILESEPTVTLGTIHPGQTATAKFRVRSQRTGAISFSNLTTGDNAVTGRFQLHMGIDERGVALSPDTIAMPDYVNELPAGLINAANRVLGQALSAATAAQLPPGVQPVSRAIVTRRALDLAEAGQRLRYGDSLNRVLSDLLLDWQGGRQFHAGFDQIFRETDAGREFHDALAEAIETADALNAPGRLVDRAADLAGRGEAWWLGAVDQTNLDFSLLIGGKQATVNRSESEQAAGYRGNRGTWLVTASQTNGAVFQWRFTNAVSRAEVAVLLVETNGSARQLRWLLTNPPPNALFSYATTNQSGQLLADLNGDGAFETALTPTATTAMERPPELLAVLQDMFAKTGRPPNPTCLAPAFGNYGTVLAVLFSKPMTQALVNQPSAYQLDNGNTANAVSIQPGGRVALLNMSWPVGAIRPRTMTIRQVADPRGNVLQAGSLPVNTNFREGVALRGRVARADGSPASGLPVTLTMNDQNYDEILANCDPFPVRVSQVITDTNGYFSIDFVLAGIPFSVSVTDTAGLSSEAVAAILDTATESQVAREKLLALADSPSVKNTLLGAFAVGSLPEAIASAEGLDRALWRDMVPLESGRKGTEVPVALRFRGRGIATGQVVASDGVTPVAQVAVNLFPDPGSREMGRGIFSDGQGRFEFHGVPLGIFTVQAQSPSGLSRTISGVLDRPGQTTNVLVVLTTLATPPCSVRGRLIEADGATPHGGGLVFIGHYAESGNLGGLVAMTSTAPDGSWHATNIPSATFDIVAISMDGKRKGERLKMTCTAGVTSYVDLTLQGLSRVTGRVETSTGIPVANAFVAGGEAVVRTDANGLFQLTGVPTGPRSISVGVERNPAAGFDFPRLGGGGVNVVAGMDNFVVVRLTPAGRIVGRVMDASGTPVPGIKVALPEAEGFRWVYADSQGYYKFDNLGLKQWTVSAPSGPAVDNDTGRLVETIRNSGSEEEIMAAIGEAFAIFTGAADPYLNGEGATFNPGTWGFNTVNLTYDGQTAVADIRYLRSGTISGIVLNGQGVPIGARVRLTGLGPLPSGMPGTVIRGERDSDPALGTFEFPGQALVGPWGLQAASPFYPIVITTNGQTYSVEPNATNIVLQFPPTREVNGRLAGIVLLPDGQPVGADVNVKISFGKDYVIRTSDRGVFDTQIALPAFEESLQGTLNSPRTYQVEAEDPASGLRGTAFITIKPGITNFVRVPLLARGSMRVIVRQASGAPAAGASLEVIQGTYPSDHYQGTTDTNGQARFDNIFQGNYAISAKLVSGPTTISGRVGILIEPGRTNQAEITLTPTSGIRGTYVRRDGVTPVSYAQIAVGNVGFMTTDTNGFFEITGVPLGLYRLISQDPVSGIGATLSVNLAYPGEVRVVQLIEQSRGEIVGRVINGYGTDTVKGAQVTLTMIDGLTPARTVTTGPDGAFSFPGASAGAFNLTAIDNLTGMKGDHTGTLPDNAPTYSIDIPLQPLATVSGIVLLPDGHTPAANATVRLWIIGGGEKLADTDENGQVHFADLALGAYELLAQSRKTTESRNVAHTNITLSAAGVAPPFTLVLPGIGQVNGQVFLNDGKTAAAGAQVTLTMQSPLLDSGQDVALADSGGRFSFPNIAIGPYRVTAESKALGASINDVINTNGQTGQVTLILSASGSVQGRLVRADGVTAAPGIMVSLRFNSHRGLPGQAVARTGLDGQFQISTIPVGEFNLEAISAEFNGLVWLDSALATNGQSLNLGNVVLDEDDPRVLSVTPSPTAVEVPVNTRVDLVFNEALATNSIHTNGIYLRSDAGTVLANLELLPDPTNSVLRWVRLTPMQPLRSQTTYEVVVLDGQRMSAIGGVIGQGPTDRYGRICAAPFISRFTTIDSDPPVLLSVFPANGTVQIDPRSVMRLSFNEPIRDTGFHFTVQGPGGAIDGAISLALNNTVLVFTPTRLLNINANYTLTVDGVRDLAGNLATNQSLSAVFATLDTLGPKIVALQIANNRPPVAGAVVALEAVLENNELNASVRFMADLTAIGTTTNFPYRMNVTLPVKGQATYRAIATDRYGNEGPLGELTFTVVTNQPPVVTLRRINPSDGPVLSSQFLTLEVGGTDDNGVTNILLSNSGAWVSSTNFATSDSTTVQLKVPDDVYSGQKVTFTALAQDTLGAWSSPVRLEFTVADSTPPRLEFINPAANTLLATNQPLVLSIRMLDNSTQVNLSLKATGSLSLTQTQTVLLPLNATVTNTMSVSLQSAAPNGGAFDIEVQAIDANSNVVSIQRSFRLPDSKPPRLVSNTPSSGAVRQSLWFAGFTLTFDEPLTAHTPLTNAFLCTNALGESIRFTSELDSSRQILRCWPIDVPLKPGLKHQCRLLPGLTDDAGNPWVEPDGATVPTDGLAIDFTTSAILQIAPTNGTSVVQGQRVNLSVQFESGLGADVIRFILNTNAPVDVPITASATNVDAFVRVPSDASEAKVKISAVKTGATSASMGEVMFVVQLRNPNNQHRNPKLDAMPVITLVRDVTTDIPVTAFDTDGNLKGLRVSMLSPTNGWQTFQWRKGGETAYAQTLGGFDRTRAGELALRDGTLAADVRSGMTNIYPLVVLAANSTLTPEYLDTLDMLFIASPSAWSGAAINPLTLAEQQALRQFVERGASAYLVASNDRYLGPNGNAANASLLDPFGLHVTGTVESTAAPATVINPMGSPWTSGPFGVVSNFAALTPGWFDNLGTNAQVIARLDANNQPTLALIKSQGLSASNGPVFLSSSAVLPEILLLNALDMSGIHSLQYDFTTPLRLRNNQNGTSLVQIVAFDADGLTSTQTVTIVTQDAVALARDPIKIDGISIQSPASPESAVMPHNRVKANVLPSVSSNPDREIILRWTTTPRRTFVIEASVDLVNWREVEATILETSPGLYEGRLPNNLANMLFLRVR